MIGIKRIGGAAEIGVFAGGTHGELVHVGLAQHDGVLRLEDLPDGRVKDRLIAGEYLGAAGGLNTLGGHIVLQGHRHALEHADLLACGDLIVHQLRGSERFVAGDVDIGVQLAVARFDLGKIALGQLGAGALLADKHVMYFSNRTHLAPPMLCV